MTRILLPTIVLVLLWAIAARAETSIKLDDIRFDTPRKQDFKQGEIQLKRRSVEWACDVPWVITVEALDADLGSSDRGGYVKKLSDLQFRLSNGRTWLELRQQPQEVNRGLAGKGSFMLDWRVLLDLTQDRPGRYRAELRFTIAEQ